MKPRHEITDKYNSNPRHQRRWELTIEWLKQFNLKGSCLDCGGDGQVTTSGIILSQSLRVKMSFTSHDLNYKTKDNKNFAFESIFAFEIVEHLLNPLVFLEWTKFMLVKDCSLYISTPIYRPKFMRNKELHFHEFNYNELVHLIDVAGFKIVDEKIINPQKWYYLFTGFRPLLRFLGFDRTILLRLKRK